MKYSALLLLASVLLVTCESKESTFVTDDGYLAGADGAQLYYRVLGGGQDSIVVVHGGPGASMHSILPSVKPLAENFTLIFYDQRGGGRSALPEDTSKLQARYFVEDLEAVRTHFGLETMNVVTHSFGSILLAQYATRYPDKIKRVVFHGATGPRRSSMAEMYKKRAALSPPSPDTSLSNKASQLLQSLLKGTATDPVSTCQEYENISRKLARLQGESTSYKGTTCKAPAEAVKYYYHKTAQVAPKSFGNWDFTGKLKEFKAPVLVIYGQQDSLALPTQREWLETIPNSRLLLVPHTGKAAFSGNPDFLFPKVANFYRGKWPQESKK